MSLSLIHPFSETFLSKSRNISAISDLFDKKYSELEYQDLFEVCSKKIKFSNASREHGCKHESVAIKAYK